MDGILLVIKPPGMTSFDVVAWLRGVLRVGKIGHAGTLDPAAAGLLPVCMGKATKAVEWFSNFDKSYRAEMVLGIETNTQDSSGEIVNEAPVALGIETIRSAFDEFIGEYGQIPPMYSAVRVKGKRLYELARKGVELERKERKIRINSLDIIYARLDAEHPAVRFDVNCSKGTYIRTLCHDIGQKLGCGAHMSFLIRTGVGPFGLSRAVTLEEVKRRQGENSLKNILCPVDLIFQNYPSIIVDERSMKLFLNGAPMECSGFCGLGANGETVRVYSGTGLFIGLGKVFTEKEKEVLKPFRLFV